MQNFFSIHSKRHYFGQ